ncbi:MAG TPA: lytic transglycosylase domain-containing protein [Solirubrobacteraceae bacterium]|nr:lytic transglycosylase domain-containing protein [Solirubrobacteraceae bacterium]
MRSRTLRRLAALAVVAATVAILVTPEVKRIVRDLTLPLQYTSTIREQARAKHLPASLIAAVIYAETKFDARTSPTGALGLMQIEPATAEFLANRSGATSFSLADLAHPDTNIAYGAYYLRYLLNHYHGNETLALAAYNGGQTNVDGWVAQAHAAGVRFGVAQIPFTETRAYVKKVENAQRRYAKDYGL